MVQRRRYRTINIVITLAGLVACMASGLMPDSTGILGDAGITLVQAMGPDQSIYQYLLPSVFALFAALLVVIDKAKILALLSALAASGIFAYMDWGYIASRQSCPAVLFNMAGVILLITGVLLQCTATPDAAEFVREERSERAEEETNQRLASHMYFDVESTPPVKDKETAAAEELEISEALAAPQEPGETEEFEEAEEPEEAENLEESEETGDLEETEEPEEPVEPEKKKKRRKKKVAVSWNTDEELADLLKKEIEKQRTEWTEESQEDED